MSWGSFLYPDVSCMLIYVNSRNCLFHPDHLDVGEMPIFFNPALVCIHAQNATGPGFVASRDWIEHVVHLSFAQLFAAELIAWLVLRDLESFKWLRMIIESFKIKCFTSSSPRPGILFWHSTWHSSWRLFWHSIRHSFCHSIWHSTWAVRRRGPAVPTELWSWRLKASLIKYDKKLETLTWQLEKNNGMAMNLHPGHQKGFRGLTPRISPHLPTELVRLYPMDRCSNHLHGMASTNAEWGQRGHHLASHSNS